MTEMLREAAMTKMTECHIERKRENFQKLCSVVVADDTIQLRTAHLFSAPLPHDRSRGSRFRICMHFLSRQHHFDLLRTSRPRLIVRPNRMVICGSFH